ncbi:unnamed protein product, partial [Mesorhabditis belari]|uniref:SET domain-containing protein n=1 Tax=Mesorhabditis belari TaxID=2138241 RepID=A0AAF3FCU3_9BILA
MAHSCLPNTTPVRILRNSRRIEDSVLVVVATEPIPVGYSITLHYGTDYVKQRLAKVNTRAEYTVRAFNRDLWEHVWVHDVNSKLFKVNSLRVQPLRLKATTSEGSLHRDFWSKIGNEGGGP